jgi:hypothetical protein
MKTLNLQMKSKKGDKVCTLREQIAVLRHWGELIRVSGPLSWWETTGKQVVGLADEQLKYHIFRKISLGHD